MTIETRLPKLTINGVGGFTPPPAPCGGEDCQYVELEVVHGPYCKEN